MWAIAKLLDQNAASQTNQVQMQTSVSNLTGNFRLVARKIFHFLIATCDEPDTDNVYRHIPYQRSKFQPRSSINATSKNVTGMRRAKTGGGKSTATWRTCTRWLIHGRYISFSTYVSDVRRKLVYFILWFVRRRNFFLYYQHNFRGSRNRRVHVPPRTR
jgi:hypothetical protein